MTKTGDDEFGPVELGEPDRLEPNENTLSHPCRETCSGWKQGYYAGRVDSTRAHQSQTELLRKRVEKLRSALEFYADAINFRSAIFFIKQIDDGKLKGLTYEDPRYSFNKKASKALADDKASEGGV